MKDILKLLCVVLFGLIGAAIPITALCLAWSWCIAQIPIGFAYVGFVKIGLALLFVLVGGGATIGLTILLGLLGAFLAAFFLTP